MYRDLMDNMQGLLAYFWAQRLLSVNSVEEKELEAGLEVGVCPRQRGQME